MHRRRVFGFGGIAVVAVAAWGTWYWYYGAPGAARPVTEVEARAYLNRIAAAAQAGDFDKLCRLNGSVLNCQEQLRLAGRDAVPLAPPTVVSTRYHQRDTLDGTPGRVLVVEGIDGHGKRYRTEVFVFRENRYNFKAINAVYWSNFGFAEGNGPSSPESLPSGSN